MGRKIAGSKTLRDIALKRGYPKKLANRMNELDARTGELMTIEQVARRSEVVNLGRLEWLLNFVQKPEDWVGLKQRTKLDDAITCFMIEPPSVVPGCAALRKIAVSIREGLLRLLVEREPWEVSVSPGMVTRRLKPFPGFIIGEYRAGNWRSAFLLSVTDLLVSHGDRIRRCTQPGCDGLFIPTKRQSYCSQACSQKARQQRFRARFTEEEWTEKRHEDYRSEVASRKGTTAAKHVKRRINRNSEEFTTEFKAEAKRDEDGTV